MTILRRIRHFILIAVFAGAFLPTAGFALLPVPVNPVTGDYISIGEPCTTLFTPCYDSAVNLNVIRVKDKLIEAILGPGMSLPGASKPGAALQIGDELFRANPGQYSSLTEYFENVWWQKFVRTEQKVADEQAKQTALEMAHLGRVMAAGDYVGYKSDMDWGSWDTQKSMLGIEEVACAGPSMGQSQTLLDMLARQHTAQISRAWSSERGGAPATAGNPETKNGPSENRLRTVEQFNTLGTCDPAGNDGANAEWCKNSQEKLIGVHYDAANLFDSTAISETSTTERASKPFVEMFVRRVFPDYFSTLRPDLMRPRMSPQAADVISRQDAYRAALSVFQYPYAKMMAEAMPNEDIKSDQYLRAALTRLGVKDSTLQNQIIGDNGVTKAGADKVLYQEYMRDPQTFTEKITWTNENVIRSLLETNMYQVTLAYDIRQQLGITNVLLGAIGSQLAREEYKDLQATTASLSARN